MSMAKDVKDKCDRLARGGFDLNRGVLWQSKRVNARPFPIFTGKLIAQKRLPKSGFQTFAIYLYTDGSALSVHRTVNKTKLIATDTPEQTQQMEGASE